MPLVLFVVVWSLAYDVLPFRLLFAYYIRCSFDCCVLFHCFTTTCSQSSVTIFSQVYAIYPPEILASDWMKKANSGINMFVSRRLWVKPCLWNILFSRAGDKLCKTLWTSSITKSFLSSYNIFYDIFLALHDRD